MTGDGAPDRRTVVAGMAALAMGASGCRQPASTAAPGARAERPVRIVSLNPCLDVILAETADRGQIAALSHYSRDAYSSTIADLARTLPITYGGGEELVSLRPDLVLSPRYGSAATRTVLERLGIETALFDVPETIAASLAQVREVARLVGHPERGETLVRRIEMALTQSAPPTGTPAVSTLVFMPGGFASGPGTLMDEMMRRAGLENAAGRYGLRGSMSVPLERIVADPPELLLAGEPTAGAPSRAERLLAHPALARVSDRMQRAAFPERLLFCGGPVLIPTAATLARARDAALARRA